MKREKFFTETSKNWITVSRVTRDDWKALSRYTNRTDLARARVVAAFATFDAGMKRIADDIPRAYYLDARDEPRSMFPRGIVWFTATPYFPRSAIRESSCLLCCRLTTVRLAQPDNTLART